jgi:hypothetical protein
MVFGLSLHTFTQAHVIISLVGIVTGLVALAGMLGAQRPDGWTKAFLIATTLTTVTGFLFPAARLTPGGVGTAAATAGVLALAIAGLYVFRLSGKWRTIYVLSAVTALWLNCFVLVIETFRKISFFNAFAPTQTEPPFLIAQVIMLAAFVVAGWMAVKRFKGVS